MKRKLFTRKKFFASLLLALLVTFLPACGDQGNFSDQVDYTFQEETGREEQEPPGQQDLQESGSQGSQGSGQQDLQESGPQGSQGSELQGSQGSGPQDLQESGPQGSQGSGPQGSQESVPPESPEQETQASLPAADLPEYGSYYYDLENVVLYLEAYGELPPNYITKKEARELGWEGGSVEDYLEGAAIGGDTFGNREGLLPEEKGRTYTECDIDTDGFGSRGSRRLVFSDDGLYFYTADHYESFSEVTVTEDWEVIW